MEKIIARDRKHGLVLTNKGWSLQHNFKKDPDFNSAPEKDSTDASGVLSEGLFKKLEAALVIISIARDIYDNCDLLSREDDSDSEPGGKFENHDKLGEALKPFDDR